ncbi:MAG TPA: MutS family DNA mismatch repair protein, partial [Bdellovibrionales bacterium]|nr:MutS family DNA mismatch repair protein [Bdellovibrionales bacterium]
SKFSSGIGLAHPLSELEPFFSRLEKRTQESEKIRGLCPTTHLAGPSKEAKKLGTVLSFLGIETNPILFLLTNTILPWSATGTWLLERRRRKIAESFPNCMRELAQLETLGSVVLFAKTQPTVFPDLGAQKLSFKGLFHPLIDRSHVIENEFEFKDDKSLGLITGSNMSGKSTFLRTVGINQCLANMGAPVFAEKFATRPMQIETCIEVSDSLRDGFSYFYSEVRRLKALLNEATSGKPVLFLIDEIFRGTNNRERRIGSRAVIKELARAKQAQGFVSTHDLELSDLEKNERAVINLHFREEIKNDQMLFSYKLKFGPSPTTNALHIMRNEGIQISEEDLV